MKQMRIKDNSYTSKEDFADIGSIIDGIADKTLGQLDKEGIFVFPEFCGDTGDLTKEQLILQSYNDTYRTGNVMGFLGAGNERLVIESRFSSGSEDYFFQYLLEKVLDFPNVINLETDTNQDNRMFHLLLYLFPSYLQSAMRKGVFKTYIRNHYNDENVKGTIDIARHIKKNTPFIGNVSYTQREYSYDNEVMELIRHTIEFIKRKPGGNQILSKAKNEVKLVIEVTTGFKHCNKRKIINDNKKNIVRHAYFKEYRALQQLCLLILQNEKQQMGAGSRKVFGILFDGAWLWEEYVNTLIEDIFYHPMNKAGKGAQWLFQTEENNYCGLIYPDFIGKNETNRLIADAKYKPMDNIGNKDYLQVLAYMFRFDAKRAYYLYPESNGKSEMKYLLNKGTSYEKNVTIREGISITKHGLCIPDKVKNYDEFVEKMKEAEYRFTEELQ